jgi:hypothetical protein
MNDPRITEIQDDVDFIARSLTLEEYANLVVDEETTANNVSSHTTGWTPASGKHWIVLALGSKLNGSGASGTKYGTFTIKSGLKYSAISESQVIDYRRYVAVNRPFVLPFGDTIVLFFNIAIGTTANLGIAYIEVDDEAPNVPVGGT